MMVLLINTQEKMMGLIGKGVLYMMCVVAGISVHTTVAALEWSRISAGPSLQNMYVLSRDNESCGVVVISDSEDGQQIAVSLYVWQKKYTDNKLAYEVSSFTDGFVIKTISTIITKFSSDDIRSMTTDAPPLPVVFVKHCADALQYLPGDVKKAVEKHVPLEIFGGT